MSEPAPQPPGHGGKCQREGEADPRVHGETVAGPGDALLVGRGPGRAAEDVPGDGHAEVEPHAEEAQPGEDLHPGEAPHGLRHRHHVADDLGGGGADARLLGCIFLKTSMSASGYSVVVRIVQSTAARKENAPM